ncbi:MAG: hypothetical protein IPN17_11360 [Deltaproteobacteria bacterium]|nr:hypothetical protein [Deltaproteobacteria bacterium]
MDPLIFAAALLLLALFTFAIRALLDRAALQRRTSDRNVVTAHWESLVMQRRDLRLAVDAQGVPTLHGRVGPIAYTIRVSALDGPWGGRPLAQAPSLSNTPRIALSRKGEREVPVPGLPSELTTGDDDFDAVFEVRCDDPEAARAGLGREVRAAMLAIPAAFACADAEGLRVDLGASATVIDHAMLDALRDVLRGLGSAAPPAVAAG